MPRYVFGPKHIVAVTVVEVWIWLELFETAQVMFYFTRWGVVVEKNVSLSLISLLSRRLLQNWRMVSYVSTVYSRTILCPIMEESPLEWSESGFGSRVLSFKYTIQREDMRPTAKRYRQGKISKVPMEASSFKKSSKKMVTADKSGLSRREARESTIKKRHNRWCSHHESQQNKDELPKRPCRYCCPENEWVARCGTRERRVTNVPSVHSFHLCRSSSRIFSKLDLYFTVKLYKSHYQFEQNAF